MIDKDQRTQVMIVLVPLMVRQTVAGMTKESRRPLPASYYYYVGRTQYVRLRTMSYFHGRSPLACCRWRCQCLGDRCTKLLCKCALNMVVILIGSEHRQG